MSQFALRPVEVSDLDAIFEQMTEVTYWIDRACWGQGIATRALGLLLEEISVRPIRARAASDNVGSL
jgi:RimJ/RimL family protein N-acetyltransferase